MTGPEPARLVDLLLNLPPAGDRHDVTADLAVPMPDGVTLLGDLYRPRSATGPLPVVLIRLPYGRGGSNGLLFGASMARRGLQVFIQSTRGTFGSGGQFRPFSTESDDGLATLAWVREQPWCDGRVAMTGGSYFGHTQWAVAPYADPPLECFSPHITASRVSEVFYTHGAPGLYTALMWSSTIGRQETPEPLRSLARPLLRARTHRAMRRLPLQAVDTELVGAPVAFWRDFTEHAGPADPFWEGANHDDVDFSALPPVNMVTGWWDLFAAGQLRDYTALREAGVEARLIVGPWLHGELGELRAMLRSDLEWLSHRLADGPAPVGAPVRVYLQQADSWLQLQQWPPPAEPVNRYLHADGGFSADPPGEGAPSGFVYDPADPTPTVGGPLLVPPAKQADNGRVERRPDVAVFTAEPEPEDLDLVGNVSAVVHLRVERPHADVFVRLCDVDGHGVSRNITDGIRRLHPDVATDGPAADVTVGEDGVLAVQVELFPTGYRLAAGHRLRVMVAGGAFPRFPRNSGTGEPFATVAEPGLSNRFELFHDDRHRSSVTLPVFTSD